MSLFSKQFNKVKSKTESVINRSADRHIRLAITGLSGAGKTAFITGLVHQLLFSATKTKDSNLPLWHVAREKRLLGVVREQQPDLAIPSFAHNAAMAQLSSELPRWPESTRNISELRLAIHFRPQSGVRGKLFDKSKLLLDIIDYPGEWLLDLPLLKLNFVEWCIEQQSRIAILSQQTGYKTFIEEMQKLDFASEMDLLVLERVAKQYQNLLTTSVNENGYYQAQPGRMLLPGDLEGSPLLTWFPLIHLSKPELEALSSRAEDNSYFSILKQRYKAYLDEVVKPFYRDHFRHFDRQVVLVDCLSALNHGQTQFTDMTQALSGVLNSFQFGQTNWLNRLFAPKIDKLLFVASKCDQITRDQQSNLLYLLNDMLSETQQLASIKGCDVETMAISAIKVTRHGLVKHQDQEVEVVEGRVDETSDVLRIFPGEVPRTLPQADFWQKQGFQFNNFQPPISFANAQKLQLEHIRLDHLLQYLLGDKLD
ncbi:YcjX family protein [Parashewanella curva]|uniref:YcjX family protein n=1 Tax=Parashewanella curva TaxID=2338552 RepID=A0A3L8PVH5_9GAMM|nr:YcjX family protein [Parashewanella curva]RLV59324.1 YcjX family protein [Parashewanella curva]